MPVALRPRTNLRLCDRMLHGKHRIEVILVVFDVLAIDDPPALLGTLKHAVKTGLIKAQTGL